MLQDLAALSLSKQADLYLKEKSEPNAQPNIFCIGLLRLSGRTYKAIDHCLVSSSSQSFGTVLTHFHLVQLFGKRSTSFKRKKNSNYVMISLPKNIITVTVT